jgi:hypothetical protein
MCAELPWVWVSGQLQPFPILVFNLPFADANSDLTEFLMKDLDDQQDLVFCSTMIEFKSKE